MDINQENSGTTNNGGKSRFLERLKKISRDKRKKTTTINEKKDGRVIFKPFVIVSSLFVGAIKNENEKQKSSNGVSDSKENLLKAGDNKNNLFNSSDLKIRSTQKSLINNKILILENDTIISDVNIKKLQKEIITLIKKRLVDNINELEMLQSELYILKEITGDSLYLEDCRENINEVKKLLTKIKNLKEKYNYLKDNTNFSNLLELGDDHLIDKILELKDICTSDDIKVTVDNYKILEEYKYLYLKIDKLEEQIIKYNDYKLDQEEELRKRDIDFDKIKSEVYNKKHEQERYDSFVLEQDVFLNKLNEKILEIDSHEVVTYKLKGFEQLVGNSFKYLGLLLVSPFKGILPGIAAETVATRNVIHNLYNNLEWESTSKIVYEAIDFSNEINVAINNLDMTLNLVNSTLEDIKRLKTKYQSDLAKYEYSFSEYSDIIKKINKMENAVINNKIKIELMQKSMREKEKQNEEKMKRVKKLNCSSNN